MLRRTLLLAAGALAWAPAAHAADAPREAHQAAERWLALVDAGDHAGSWQQAGAMFKGAMDEQRWTRSVGAVRGPLGALRERRPRSAETQPTLPGLPDGQYVVLAYDAAFAHKAAAVETVTLVKEPDGAWRVIGYFIR
jgi:opacity protein-like surface antigen